jgi:probable F420-dependent oxidoreductase
MGDTGTVGIRFSLQGEVRGRAADWHALARRAEALGFDTLYVADHPGETASPFVALAAAAAVTSTLRLGTYVCNVGLRDPVQLASDAATVDGLSDGRLTLGLGVGHTPAEWAAQGLPYPSARERVDRLEHVVDVVSARLGTDDGSFAPRPVQDPIPLLIGGNGRRVLRLAATRADIVAMSGLGRTLPDGHRHAVEWNNEAIDERVRIVREASAGRAVVLDALVQHCEITSDRAAAAARVASVVPGLDPAHALSSPFMLIGTVDEIVAELHAHRARWGITSYVVRANAIDAAAQLIRCV